MKVRKSRKKKSLQAIFFQVFFGFAILAIAVFLIVSNFKIARKRQKLISQINILKEEIKVLEKKNAQLKAGISQTQSESFLEKEARERLGLKKPGEEVVAIKKIETEKEKELKQEKTLWQKILEKVQFWRD